MTSGRSVSLRSLRRCPSATMSRRCSGCLPTLRRLPAVRRRPLTSSRHPMRSAPPGRYSVLLASRGRRGNADAPRRARTMRIGLKRYRSSTTMMSNGGAVCVQRPPAPGNHGAADRGDDEETEPAEVGGRSAIPRGELMSEEARDGAVHAQGGVTAALYLPPVLGKAHGRRMPSAERRARLGTCAAPATRTRRPLGCGRRSWR